MWRWRQRVVPWSVRTNQLVGFAWPPTPLCIGNWRGILVQHRLYDTPLGVDNILSTEKVPDAKHGVAKKALIGWLES
jgi:hypothetical protein